MTAVTAAADIAVHGLAGAQDHFAVDDLQYVPSGETDMDT